MKTKLIFDNENYDDVKALKRAMHSTDMAITLFEIQYNLKKQCERELESLEDSDGWDGVEIVFRRLGELFEEHGINIGELIE